MNKAKLLASAQQYLRRGQHNKAIAEYDKLLKDDPNDVRTLLNLANVHYRQKHYKDAVSVFLDAGRIYEQGGFALKAIAVYKQVLSIVKDRDDLHIVLAGLYQSQGRLNEAADEYRHAMNILNQKNDRNGKLDLIRLVLEMDPDNIKDRLHLAEAFSASGQIADAVQCFRKVADLLERQGKTKAFQRIAERMLYHQPDDASMAKKLAASYAASREPQRALSKVKLAFRATPRDLETLGILVDVFNQLGQVHKAVTVLKHMAQLYRANGLAAEADECYQEILAVSPEDDSAKRAIKTSSNDEAGETGELFVFDGQTEGDFTPAFPQVPEVEALIMAESDAEAIEVTPMAIQAASSMPDAHNSSSVAVDPSERPVSDAAQMEGGAHVLHELLAAAIDEDLSSPIGAKDPLGLGDFGGPQSSPTSAPPGAELEALFRVAYKEVEASSSAEISSPGGGADIISEVEWDAELEAFDFDLEGFEGEGDVIEAIDTGDLVSGVDLAEGFEEFQEITSVDVLPIDADQDDPQGDEGQSAFAQPEESEGTGASFAEELRELDFYLANGLVAEARVALNQLHRRYENHPKVVQRLEKLERMG